jgi:hypothetical protein
MPNEFRISVLLHTEHSKMLSILQAFTGYNASQVVRDLIQTRFESLPPGVQNLLPSWHTYKEQLRLTLLDPSLSTPPAPPSIPTSQE